MVDRRGFTFVEAMVSIAVLGIIATISTYSLSASSRTDQLNTAARVLAADLRSVQSQALTAANIKTCPDPTGIPVVCEASDLVCPILAQCLPSPPPAIGIHLVSGQRSYAFFADVRPATNDWVYTTSSEEYLTRSLDKAGALDVIISAVSSTTGSASPSDVVFERQNGSMVLNGCRISQGCNIVTSLIITLKHTRSLATKTVSVNAYTGRISIQ